MWSPHCGQPLRSTEPLSDIWNKRSTEKKAVNPNLTLWSPRVSEAILCPVFRGLFLFLVFTLHLARASLLLCSCLACSLTDWLCHRAAQIVGLSRHLTSFRIIFLRAYFKVLRQKVPYFNVSRQKVPYFNILWQKIPYLNISQQNWVVFNWCGTLPLSHSLSISSHFLSPSSTFSARRAHVPTLCATLTPNHLTNRQGGQWQGGRW